MNVDRKAHSLLFLSLAVLMLWIAGCSGSRSTTDHRPDLPDVFPNHTLAQIQQQVRLAAGDTLTSFEGKATLSLRSPDFKGNVTARIAHRRLDSLYMTLTATLGIEAARMLITPDSFFVYDRINKKLNYGSMAYAENVVPAAFTGEDAFRTLLGLLLPEPDIAWQLDADTSYYHLHDEAGRRHYIIDPTIWRVVRFEERTPQGGLVEARTFAEHDVFNRVFIPRRIILQRPLDDTNISMYYRELTLNPPMLSLMLEVGDSVERVLINETTNTTNE